MPKNIYKAKCERVLSNPQGSTAIFGVGVTEINGDQPGQKKRMAKNIIQIQFATPDGATVYKVGKDYTVTIDG